MLCIFNGKTPYLGKPNLVKLLNHLTMVIDWPILKITIDAGVGGISGGVSVASGGSDSDNVRSHTFININSIHLVEGT